MSEQNVQQADIERVARAICEGDGFDWNKLKVDHEIHANHLPDIYLRRAKDAITALRHRTRAEPDLVEAAKRVLEWWPAPSEETSLPGKSYGGTFAADIQALRAALIRADA